MSSERDESLELTQLSKEELIAKVERLIASNKQLKNQVKNMAQKSSKKSYKKPGQRVFQFSNCNEQKIALRLTYIGWDYQGFAFQDNTDNTIEEAIFDALIKTCLIKDRHSCEYSRCGRTDKGVSAFGQVISLKVRAAEEGKGNAIDYVKVLNRVLPPEIRILAWAPVSNDFDARFSCLTRTYKYFFPASGLDILVMNSACDKLVGEHDFRNFCKVDVGNNVNHFVRKVLKCEINRLAKNDSDDFEDQMFEVTISGMAFLWHQVRCMVSILFLVGLHLEEPEVVDHLLDVTKIPKKPQYTMVSEVPLILFDCEFADVDWIFPVDQNQHLISQFQNFWTNQAVRASMMALILKRLSSVHQDTAQLTGGLLFPLMTGHRKNNYQPLLSRPVCDGIERHLEKQAVKRKMLEERCSRKKKDIKHD